MKRSLAVIVLFALCLLGGCISSEETVKEIALEEPQFDVGVFTSGDLFEQPADISITTITIPSAKANRRLVVSFLITSPLFLLLFSSFFWLELSNGDASPDIVPYVA